MWKLKTHRNEIEKRRESLVSPCQPLTAIGVRRFSEQTGGDLVPVPRRDIIVDLLVIEVLHLVRQGHWNVGIARTTRSVPPIEELAERVLEQHHLTIFPPKDSF